MQPNPQTLIDLPGAGNAEKALRKAGLWRVVLTDKERIEWLAEWVQKMNLEKYGFERKFVLGDTDLDADYLREDIDNAATQREME